MPGVDEARTYTQGVVGLVHGMVLDPPLGRTADACAEEIVAACLGYVGYPIGTSTMDLPER